MVHKAAYRFAFASRRRPQPSSPATPCLAIIGFDPWSEKPSLPRIKVHILTLGQFMRILYPLRRI